MRDYSRFSTSDFSAAIDLVGEVHEVAANRGQQVEHLVRGLCRIVNGQVGIYSELHQYLPGESLRIEPRLDFGWGGGGGAKLEHAVLRGGTTGRSNDQSNHRPERDDDHAGTERACFGSGLVSVGQRDGASPPVHGWIIASTPISLSAGHGVSIALHRAWGDQPFTARDAAIVDAIHDRQRIYATPSPSPMAGLTPRQREILEGLLSGESEKQVALRLGISIHTVHEHVKTIYQRLGVSSRAELLSLWVRRDAKNGAVSIQRS